MTLAFAITGCDRGTAKATPAAGSPPDTLRVVSLNIYRGKLGLEPIAAMLRGKAPDVVLLQEVLRGEHAPGGQDQAAVLAEAVGKYRVYSADRLGRRDDHKYGDPAILSRWPLKDVRLIESEGGGRPYALKARLVRGGRPLHLFSVHCNGTFKFEMGHIVDSIGTRWRQVVELAELVGSLEGDVIIGGDFNATEWMAEYVLIRRHWDDFAPAADASSPLLTFPAARPFMRIDHLFGVGEFEAGEFQVATEIVSDHRAVVADLRRRSEPRP